MFSHTNHLPPKKLRECSRIFFGNNIMEPSMTLLGKKINSLCQPSKLVWVRERLHLQFMSAHKLVLLTLALTCACPLVKNPTFPQQHYISLWLSPSIFYNFFDCCWKHYQCKCPLVKLAFFRNAVSYECKNGY